MGESISKMFLKIELTDEQIIKQEKEAMTMVMIVLSKVKKNMILLISLVEKPLLINILNCLS